MSTLTASYAGARIASLSRSRRGLARLALGMGIYGAGAALALSQARQLLVSLAGSY